MSSKPIINVAVGILEFDKSFLVGRRSKDFFSSNIFWEFPGGKIEENESPEECLVREFFEETGLAVIPKSLIMETKYDYGNHIVNLFFYSCSLVEVFSFQDMIIDGWEWRTKLELKEVDFLPANKQLVLYLLGKR